MAKNEFKPFATANGANVTTQADYETLPARSTGFQSGKASSANINKAIRQATVIASAVAQFIADESGDNVLDDGDVAALQQSLLAALKQNAADNLPKASTTVSGITALSSATNSSDETAAATPKAVKAANDNANSRLLATGTAAAAIKLATARTINGVAFDGSTNVTITAAANGGTAATTTGNAGSATKLATARTINGVAFDGSTNITVTAAANGGTADTASTANKLTTVRTINGVAFDGSSNITLTPANIGALATTATAAAATKLATARAINGVAFDGSGDITITAAANGGTAATTTGNAGTATKLAAARTIGGVSFDGTANINLPGVNVVGNQSTTGNAATATKLATARTINGVAFDGSADIKLTPQNLGLVEIVETGSGTGYYWRKYADGKVEIFARFNLTIGASLDVVFPKGFTDIPIMLIKENGGAEVNGWVIRLRNLSKTGFSVAWNTWSPSGSGSAIDVCYHAIGS